MTKRLSSVGESVPHVASAVEIKCAATSDPGAQFRVGVSTKGSCGYSQLLGKSAAALCHRAQRCGGMLQVLCARAPEKASRRGDGWRRRAGGSRGLPPSVRQCVTVPSCCSLWVTPAGLAGRAGVSRSAPPPNLSPALTRPSLCVLFTAAQGNKKRRTSERKETKTTQRAAHRLVRPQGGEKIAACQTGGSLGAGGETYLVQKERRKSLLRNEPMETWCNGYRIVSY